MNMESHPPLDAALVQWLQEVADRGLFITDTALVMRRWNQWLAAQTGRPEADAIGRHLFDLYPTLPERGYDQYYRDALAGGVRILSERFHHYLLPISRNLHGAGVTDMAQTARIEPLWRHGAVVGTITLIEDVTERVITERELRNQIAASEQARDLAEQASRLKDEFLATLSHEIRTPLNAVMGWARILRTEDSPRARSRALDIIERNALSQLRLVEDLLDMSRILNGKLPLVAGRVDLAQVVRAAVEVVVPTALAKRVTVTATCEADLPAVGGDADRLQQVVWNLASNAVKFTGAGGAVQINLARAGDHLRLTVRDNGEGIAPDFLPHVFDRFRQQDASPSRNHGGLGLGLALVRHIVELHGGRVGVESAGLGRGATFWATLPISVAEERVPPADTETGPVTLEGISVLIVDDDDDAREMVVALLGHYGARAQGVSSAEAALAELAKHGGETDVLVSDVGMADVDGYDLIRRVRSMREDAARMIPAIAVTAYANADDRVRAIVAGYQTHVSKPVDAGVLATSIANIVKGKITPRSA
jgi:signal transduction histidine kinase/ActR/RegA family two-component response regulator